MDETRGGKISPLTREALETLSRDELINMVLRQAKAIEIQAEQISRLGEKVAELEERLGMNSRNSSKPPSSDPPGNNVKMKQEPSGRKPGAQPGHNQMLRALIPTEDVDKVVPLKPGWCERCQKPLHGDDPMPHRHQVTEIPKVKPQVTEYQQYTLTCSGCGHQTTASLPEGVTAGGFGPRLESTAALLTGDYHLSKRAGQEILRDIFGVEMSLGALSGCEETVGALLEGPVAEAHAWVQEQATAHADETGWKEKNKCAWLWVMATKSVTVFQVRARRTKEAARQLLGRFGGVLHTDRWGAYNIYKGLRQLCWAHLLRDFTAFSEFRGPAAGRIGKDLLRRGRRLFRLWHNVRDGTWNREQYQQSTVRLRADIERSLQEGADCPHRKMRHVCRRILKHADSLWTFTRLQDVEPTNNMAESRIRPAVLWRRKSFGTQSARGSRFVERMLTATATLRQQGRNVADYMEEVCAASVERRPAPSLLPMPKFSK